MPIPAKFSAFHIHQDATGHRAGIASLALDQLNSGDVVIRAAW